MERLSGLTAPDVHTLSPLSLAYLGDGVYELMIREKLLFEGNCPPASLHTRAVSLVRAPAQAAAARRILPALTEEELAVFRRGRNAHPARRTPQNSSAEEYHLATALECLFGWLYVLSRGDRLRELLALGLTGEETGGNEAC